MKMTTMNGAEADGDWRRVQKPQLNLEANLSSQKKNVIQEKYTASNKKFFLLKHGKS